MVTLFPACAGAPDKPDPPVPADSATSTDSRPDDTATDDTAGPDPADLDGDGFVALSYGGDDCDDHDAFTHPGAEEWCDAEDQDCDGDPLAEGVCGKVQEAREGFGVTLVTGKYPGSPTLVGDVTGDGVPDLYMASWYEDTERTIEDNLAGVSAVYSGASVGDLPFTYPEGAAHAWREEDGVASTGVVVIDGGDVNGDGVGDVLIMDQLYSPATYVHFGPHDDGAETPISDADLVWYPDDFEQQGTHAVSADFDLDGRSDYVLEVGTSGTLDVFAGGTPTGYAPVIISDASFGAMTKVGDLDGDGAPDLVSAGHWFSGADLAAADGASEEDLALAYVWPSSEWSPDWEQDPWMDMGDLTGDGVPDLASVGDSNEMGNGDNALLFYDGTLRGEFTPDDAFGSWIWNRIGYFGACDVNGDGGREIIAGAQWQAWHGDVFRTIIRGPTTAPGPNDPFPEDHLDLSYHTPVTCGPDVTGDGLEDLAFARQKETDDDLMLIGVLPGFEIPWDDPFYW